MSSEERTVRIDAIRRDVEALRGAPAAGASGMAFGLGALDDRLGGGLAQDALHELSASSASLADECAMTLFTAGLAGRRAAVVAAPILWVVTRFDLYAPGLGQAGLPAAAVIYAQARDDAEALGCVEDAVRDGTPAAVVAEVRRASMTSTRRLQLACGDRGVPVLLLRRATRLGADPLAEPSAAATRWRIGCVPSPRPEAGLARARWSVELVRRRGGQPFSLVLEACDHEGRLAVPAPAADRAAPAAGAVRIRAA